MKLVRRFVALAALAYFLAALGMYVFQRDLQYFPAHRGLSPAAVGLRGARAVTLSAPDGAQMALWYAPAPKGRPTILYFQGNAGEIADRPKRFAYYQAHGFGVAFLSYRGFGASSGEISEAGLILDAETAYDWLLAQGVSTQNLLLVGESLGTGVAVALAARRPVGAVALEAPFAAAVDVAALRYPWLPVTLLMKDQFRSIERIGQINAPLLIQHGDADQVIPFDEGQRLFAAAREPKQFERIGGVGHEILFQSEVWQAEVRFFERSRAP